MLKSLQVIFGEECVVIWRPIFEISFNANCWTDSSDVDTDEEDGSQITAPYSSIGRTNILYSVSSVAEEQLQ